MYVRSLECCGILELVDISGEIGLPGYDDRKDGVELVVGYAARSSAAHFIFSEAGRPSEADYARLLAAYIRKHKLGTVVRSRSAVNPNSGNSLRAFLWTPNRAALQRWRLKHNA